MPTEQFSANAAGERTPSERSKSKVKKCLKFSQFLLFPASSVSTTSNGSASALLGFPPQCQQSPACQITDPQNTESTDSKLTQTPRRKTQVLLQTRLGCFNLASHISRVRLDGRHCNSQNLITKSYYFC